MIEIKRTERDEKILGVVREFDPLKRRDLGIEMIEGSGNLEIYEHKKFRIGPFVWWRNNVLVMAVWGVFQDVAYFKESYEDLAKQLAEELHEKGLFNKVNTVHVKESKRTRYSIN